MTRSQYAPIAFGAIAFVREAATAPPSGAASIVVGDSDHAILGEGGREQGDVAFSILGTKVVFELFCGAVGWREERRCVTVA